jgi:hypothetical protein
MTNDDIAQWLESGKHLPEPMRDFHDQKDLFKSIHYLYQDNENFKASPNWADAHVYVIDAFLWFMASRGYTLQKTRKKNIAFKDWPNFRELTKND